MAKTAAGLSENPGSTDDLVRDLEDSGYPVDGAREQLIRQPDGLSAVTGRVVTGPVQPDRAEKAAPPQAQTKARAVAT